VRRHFVPGIQVERRGSGQHAFAVGVEMRDHPNAMTLSCGMTLKKLRGLDPARRSAMPRSDDLKPSTFVPGRSRISFTVIGIKWPFGIFCKSVQTDAWYLSRPSRASVGRTASNDIIRSRDQRVYCFFFVCVLCYVIAFVCLRFLFDFLKMVEHMSLVDESDMLCIFGRLPARVMSFRYSGNRSLAARIESHCLDPI